MVDIIEEVVCAKKYKSLQSSPMSTTNVNNVSLLQKGSKLLNYYYSYLNNNTARCM